MATEGHLDHRSPGWPGDGGQGIDAGVGTLHRLRLCYHSLLPSSFCLRLSTEPQKQRFSIPYKCSDILKEYKGIHVESIFEKGETINKNKHTYTHFLFSRSSQVMMITNLQHQKHATEIPYPTFTVAWQMTGNITVAAVIITIFSMSFRARGSDLIQRIFHCRRSGPRGGGGGGGGTTSGVIEHTRILCPQCGTSLIIFVLWDAHKKCYASLQVRAKC